MSFVIASIDGLNCPRFDCDECGEPIRDAKLALVCWDMLDDSGSVNGPPQFLHKGRCLDKFASVPLPGAAYRRWLGTEEVVCILYFLLLNLGLSIKDLKDVQFLNDRGIP